jgi:hypothetical protein
MHYLAILDFRNFGMRVANQGAGYPASSRMAASACPEPTTHL